MAELEFARRIGEDFRRVLAHLREYEVTDAPQRITEIVEALQVLRLSPLIGRPVGNGRHELVIGLGSRGYVALYRFVAVRDLVVVMAIKSQRGAGYRH
jgi:toxin ParE1/3/4